MRMRMAVPVAVIGGLLWSAGAAGAVEPGVGEPREHHLIVGNGDYAGEAKVTARELPDGEWVLTGRVTKLVGAEGCAVLQADEGTGPGWSVPKGQELARVCGAKGATVRVRDMTGHPELRLRWVADEGPVGWVSEPLRSGATAE
ncbi:hypothetical protein G5C51_29890 [Streptomyces sp. A7024]|uniref:Secreted protein n=1 Tax=Streptomyces coryli TaxID=1128680 RepID=A0A6G4U782_9ACTN|nr:hypothetical protein [Streptomyces coryli]NGN68099.1 hypothetical protein [Streptomyces coryli]